MKGAIPKRENDYMNHKGRCFLSPKHNGLFKYNKFTYIKK